MIDRALKSNYVKILNKLCNNLIVSDTCLIKNIKLSKNHLLRAVRDLNKEGFNIKNFWMRTGYRTVERYYYLAHGSEVRL
jgi:hypothetical protein